MGNTGNESIRSFQDVVPLDSSFNGTNETFDTLPISPFELKELGRKSLLVLKGLSKGTTGNKRFKKCPFANVSFCIVTSIPTSSINTSKVTLCKAYSAKLHFVKLLFTSDILPKCNFANVRTELFFQQPNF